MEKFYGVDLRSIKAEDMLTVEECAYVMRALDSEIARLDASLVEAKGIAASTGVFKDPRWFRDMTLLLKAKRRARVMAQDRRSVLVKKAKQAESAVFSQQFIQAALEILDRETYSKIMERARMATFQTV